MKPGLDQTQQIAIADHAVKSGNLDFATSILQQLLQSSPTNYKAHELMAIVYLQKGDMNNAALFLKKSLSCSGATFYPHYLLGSIYLSCQQYKEASAHLKHCVTSGGRFFEALHNLGTALWHEGHHEEALGYLDQSIALNANHPEAWNSRGLILQHLSRHTEAVDAFEKTIALIPLHATAWSNLGKSFYSLRRLPEAKQAFQQSLKLSDQPDLVEINKYVLASIDGESAPDKAPASYVKDLFDKLAENFEETLTGKLGYQAPQIFFQELEEIKKDTNWTILDLGCGTGLCGKILHSKASRMDGIDISEGMLEKAHELNIYNELICTDIADFLENNEKHYDIIISADVFVYLGNLRNIFRHAHKALTQNGIFCFSTEDLNDAKGLFSLTSTGRYAHSAKYIQNLSQENGLRIIKTTRNVTRTERGEPVHGLFYFLTRNDATLPGMDHSH